MERTIKIEADVFAFINEIKRMRNKSALNNGYYKEKLIYAWRSLLDAVRNNSVRQTAEHFRHATLFYYIVCNNQAKTHVSQGEISDFLSWYIRSAKAKVLNDDNHGYHIHCIRQTLRFIHRFNFRPNRTQLNDLISLLRTRRNLGENEEKYKSSLIIICTFDYKKGILCPSVYEKLVHSAIENKHLTFETHTLIARLSYLVPKHSIESKLVNQFLKKALELFPENPSKYSILRLCEFILSAQESLDHWLIETLLNVGYDSLYSKNHDFYYAAKSLEYASHGNKAAFESSILIKYSSLINAEIAKILSQNQEISKKIAHDVLFALQRIIYCISLGKHRTQSSDTVNSLLKHAIKLLPFVNKKADFLSRCIYRTRIAIQTHDKEVYFQFVDAFLSLQSSDASYLQHGIDILSYLPNFGDNRLVHENCHNLIHLICDRLNNHFNIKQASRLLGNIADVQGLETTTCINEIVDKVILNRSDLGFHELNRLDIFFYVRQKYEVLYNLLHNYESSGGQLCKRLSLTKLACLRRIVSGKDRGLTACITEYQAHIPDCWHDVDYLTVTAILGLASCYQSRKQNKKAKLIIGRLLGNLSNKESFEYALTFTRLVLLKDHTFNDSRLRSVALQKLSIYADRFPRCELAKKIVSAKDFLISRDEEC